MYRCMLDELRKEKGFSYKKWSEESGISVDTITRIIHPENPDKDSPRVNTLEDLCKPLGVEVWEIFYLGDRSFISLQDELIAENAILKKQIENEKEKNSSLKDQIIDIHTYYMKKLV